MATPVKIVWEAYEAFACRDLAKVFSLLSPSVEIVQSAALPWGGEFHGHDGARQFFSRLTATIDSRLEIERLIDAGDHVVAIGWTNGAVVATGATYRVAIAHVWEVRDGQVARVMFLVDSPALLAALEGGNKTSGGHHPS